MAGFKMNPGWEKELEKAIQPAMKNIASGYQKMFDSLSRRYKGRPVSAMKPVLKREWARVGGSISDPELTEYATHIGDGNSDPDEGQVDPVECGGEGKWPPHSTSDREGLVGLDC